MMELQVGLFARFRDEAGTESVTIQLPAGSEVRALRRCLAEFLPQLAGLLQRSAIAVNGEFAGDDTRLAPGDELAVIPPVSGG